MNQPKVFIGLYQEFMNVCKEKDWNPKKVILLNNFSGLDRLRGITLKEQEICYGETIGDLHPDFLREAYIQIRILTSIYKEVPNGTDGSSEGSG